MNLNTHYYSFGSPINGRSVNAGTTYAYGMNGQEKDDEIASGIYTAEFWEYDSRTGRRWNTDPVVKPNISSYACFDNNPIFYIDVYGDDPGDYYGKDGKHLGSDGKADDKVYAADGVTKDKKGNVTGATNAVDLGVTHTDFAITSNIVKHEGSGGNKDESLWIAHTANNAKDNDAIDYKKQNTTLKDQLMDANYSTTPASARTALSVTDDSQGANFARAAVISVHSGAADPTGGAVLWDGTDFLSKGSSHNKFKEYGNVKIDKNTVLNFYYGVESYKAGKPFNVKISTFATPIIMSQDLNMKGSSKANYNLNATGTKGASIFWKIQKK